MVQSSPCFSNSSGVGQHAYCTRDFGHISSRDSCGWLIVDAYFEARWAPVHKLNSALVLDACYGTVDILGHNVSPVQKAAGHVLSMPRVTLDHLVVGLKTCSSNVGNSQAFVRCLIRTEDRCIGYQRKVDSRIRYQVGLEFSEIHIKGTIEPR